MTVLHICMVTRNKSISATTLHTAMNLHMLAMQRSIHLEIHFVDDKSSLLKVIKSGDRIFWMDYGTNLNVDEIPRVLDTWSDGVNVVVFPSVKEGINWDQFKKKTVSGTTEPASQRGLDFDTIVGKKYSDGFHECLKTSARVWAMDAKPVDKKLRGGKEPLNLPLNDTMFDFLRTHGIKIAAATNAIVVCHFVHECFGNILEASGVSLEP